MRHRNAHRKLGRVSEHRLALLRNQATALLWHERIETTLPKAKELRPFVEKLITIAKRGVKAADPKGKTLSARRLVMRDVHDEDVVTKLFDSLAPRFAERPGGYTRILKLGHRRGDAAEVAQIELVGSEFDPKKAEAERNPIFYFSLLVRYDVAVERFFDVLEWRSGTAVVGEYGVRGDGVIDVVKLVVEVHVVAPTDELAQRVDLYFMRGIGLVVQRTGINVDDISRLREASVDGTHYPPSYFKYLD